MYTLHSKSLVCAEFFPNIYAFCVVERQHMFSHEQYGMDMMECCGTKWNEAQYTIAEGKILTCHHTHIEFVSHTHTYTPILFKCPNPLCESVSLVVTNTIGLFTCVCVHGVYISKTETDCGSVIGLFMSVCAAGVSMSVCEEREKESLYRNAPTLSLFSLRSNLFSILTLRECVCRCVCMC